jgi:hypothetical protein
MATMNKFISSLLGLGLALFGQAHAQTQDSFDREFAKFDKDFERLNTWKAETPASKKLKRAPAAAEAQPVAGEQGTTPLDAGTPVPDDKASITTDKASEPPADADKAPNAKTSALPKGAKVERLARNDRLGHQISDPEMRKKVEALYRRSDVVVQQYVLPTN